MYKRQGYASVKSVIMFHCLPFDSFTTGYGNDDLGEMFVWTIKQIDRYNKVKRLVLGH